MDQSLYVGCRLALYNLTSSCINFLVQQFLACSTRMPYHFKDRIFIQFLAKKFQTLCQVLLIDFYQEFPSCLLFQPCSYLQFRLGKTGSLRPWRRVMQVHRRKPSLCQNDPHIGGSFWLSEDLLQCTMTLLQGPKDLVLPNLTYV